MAKLRNCDGTEMFLAQCRNDAVLLRRFVAS
jgi:hypothetical protein